MKHLFTFLLPVLLGCVTSCDLINPEEPVPAYIEVQEIKVTTDFSLQGSAASKISDAWIFVDDNLVGAFELPCRIPALYSGSHKLAIGPGVKINGISATRAPYPFYKSYITTVNFEPGKAISLEPVVTYFDSINFAFLANFDDLSGNRIEAAPSSDTTAALTSIPSEVFEGNGSFKATLLRDSGYVAFQMVDAISLPQGGNLVYMELNYSCTEEVTVGITANYSGSSVNTRILYLGKTEGWNKIYINLTPSVTASQNAENFRIYFTSYKAPGTQPLKLFIDNLKIIY